MLASRQLLDVDIVVLVNLRFDWIEKMIDWIGDTFLAVVTSLPALFVDQDSPRFLLMRGMLGLILNCLNISRIPQRHVAISVLLCALHEDGVESIRTKILSYSLRRFLPNAVIRDPRLA